MDHRPFQGHKARVNFVDQWDPLWHCGVTTSESEPWWSWCCKETWKIECCRGLPAGGPPRMGFKQTSLCNGTFRELPLTLVVRLHVSAKFHSAQACTPPVSGRSLFVWIQCWRVVQLAFCGFPVPVVVVVVMVVVGAGEAGATRRWRSSSTSSRYAEDVLHKFEGRMLQVHLLRKRRAVIITLAAWLLLVARTSKSVEHIGVDGGTVKINSRTFRCTFYLDLAKDVKVSVEFEFPALLCFHLSVNSKHKDRRLKRARSVSKIVKYHWTCVENLWFRDQWSWFWWINHNRGSVCRARLMWTFPLNCHQIRNSALMKWTDRAQGWVGVDGSTHQHIAAIAAVFYLANGYSMAYPELPEGWR